MPAQSLWRPAVLLMLGATLACCNLCRALPAMTQSAQAAPSAPSQRATPAAQRSDTAATDPIAPAETLLFQSNHLRNIHPPATLVYSFHHQGSLDAGFDDEVRLAIDAQRAATLQFLSGERQRRTPAVDDPEGNPVLLGFLERDIAEMHRLTGGSSNYFRKRIRLALARAAQVRTLRFSFNGKKVDGREVAIAPYRGDPMHERFEQFADKRYLFVVSEQVPGAVFRVRTLVPGAANRQPLIDETLTLDHVEASR